MMVFPADWDYEDEEARDAVRDEWEEWFEVAEDEQIIEGNISISETIDGQDPIPELDKEDVLAEFDKIVDEDALDKLP